MQHLLRHLLKYRDETVSVPFECYSEAGFSSTTATIQVQCRLTMLHAAFGKMIFIHMISDEEMCMSPSTMYIHIYHESSMQDL